MDEIVLSCHKTGREYKAEVTEEDGVTTVDTTCPFCENRGVEAILDDIRQDIERASRRGNAGP